MGLQAPCVTTGTPFAGEPDAVLRIARMRQWIEPIHEALWWKV